MQIHHLLVPARKPEPAQAELITLLARVRLLAVHRQWLDDGSASGWAR